MILEIIFPYPDEKKKYFLSSDPYLLHLGGNTYTLKALLIYSLLLMISYDKLTLNMCNVINICICILCLEIYFEKKKFLTHKFLLIPVIACWRAGHEIFKHNGKVEENKSCFDYNIYRMKMQQYCSIFQWTILKWMWTDVCVKCKSCTLYDTSTEIYHKFSHDTASVLYA